MYVYCNKNNIIKQSKEWNIFNLKQLCHEHPQLDSRVQSIRIFTTWTHRYMCTSQLNYIISILDIHRHNAVALVFSRIR